MRLKFIVCKAIQREAYYCASRSTNIVDVIITPQGLHNEPINYEAVSKKR